MLLIPAFRLKKSAELILRSKNDRVVPPFDMFILSTGRLESLQPFNT
jgi:hypothetical protein